LRGYIKSIQVFFYLLLRALPQDFIFTTYLKLKLEMGRAFEFRKARKMKRWSAMSKAFTRIGKDIVIAVKEGGADPDSNSRLRAVIQNAKSVNMPKVNVERAIKKATDKDTANFETVLFEGYAPHGIAVLVETSTDNNNRTVANVRSFFNKCDGNLGTSGSVEFMFEHKCHFRIPAEGIDIEELELALIDFGAEELFTDEKEEEDNNSVDGIMIYAEFQNYGALQKALEEMNMEILSSDFEYISTIQKEVTAAQREDVDKLLEKLDEDDDVNNVYTTMQEEQ
jgi:YebC/PmpR family DNA-binding regulatory protein